MNSRTVTVIVVVIIVLGAIYGITAHQQGAKTEEHISALTSDDTAAVVKALEGLSSGGARVVDRVQSALASGDAQIRSRAVTVIGLCGTTQNAPPLQKILADDTDKFVRRDAAVALGNLGAAEAAPDLASALNSEDEELIVRAAAARALARLGYAGAVPSLIKVIEDRPPLPPAVPEGEEPEPIEDTNVTLRVAAAQALGWLAKGDAAAVTALGNSLRQDADKAVRRAAATSLGSAMMDNPRADEVSAAVAALIDGMEDEEGDVRTAIVVALGHAGAVSDELLRGRLQRAITSADNDEHYWVREAAALARRMLPAFDTSA